MTTTRQTDKAIRAALEARSYLRECRDYLATSPREIRALKRTAHRAERRIAKALIREALA